MKRGRTALIALASFAGGVFATLLFILLNSLYQPILRLSPANEHPKITSLASRVDGVNVVERFRVDDPEFINVGLKGGSLGKCVVTASGARGQPPVEVTSFNRTFIRPFEGLRADILFRARFAPGIREAVESWKIECYDDLGKYAFRLRVPAH